MNMNIFGFFRKRFKKYQTIAERLIFPVLLALYPFVSVDQGIDISDVTYSLGNYQYFDLMDINWKLSIFIPSLVGHLMTYLPGAGTMLGMKIYATLFVSAMALVVYYALKTIIPGWMVFISEWIAISLSWCPYVILYNYMTYLFMTLGLLFLLDGIMTYEGRRQNRRLFLAGVFLGGNVLVRLPNVLEASFILILFFAGFVNKEKIKSIALKTVVCVSGYVVGVMIPLTLAIAMYGFKAYGSMLGWLSEVSADSDNSHSIAATTLLTLSAYKTTVIKMAVMIPCIAAGVILFYLLSKRKTGIRILNIAKIIYLGGILVLVKFYFATGVFTTNYWYYDSMFQAAMMFIVLSLVLDILDIFSAFAKEMDFVVIMPGTEGERIMAFLSLMVIVITPIGSDNYTFPIVNNLFLVAPITLAQLRRVARRATSIHIPRTGLKTLEQKNKFALECAVHFPWKYMCVMIVLIVIVQGSLFKAGYSFVDGADGRVRDSKVTSVDKLKGLYTTNDNVVEIESLYQVFTDNDLFEYELLQFGESPGLSYAFDVEPSIYTTWPTLESNTVERFDEALMDISARPVIITDADMMTEYQDSPSVLSKIDVLLDYIASNGYNIVFEDENYIVYVPCD